MIRGDQDRRNNSEVFWGSAWEDAEPLKCILLFNSHSPGIVPILQTRILRLIGNESLFQVHTLRNRLR